MSAKGMTTMTVKKINKNKVYTQIYNDKFTSKQQIVQKLEMGLSTVGQNLKILEEEGLIERSGNFESTGGRKAQTIHIVRDAKISIGIGILKDTVYLVSIDLYGEIMHSSTLSIQYKGEEAYYQTLGEHLEHFLQQAKLRIDSILGVSIATQGIISPDGQGVSYGVIMNNAQMQLSDFSKYIPYSCHLEHDSKAAAYLELWNHKEIDNATLLLLNQNLGGALIMNRTVHHGVHMRGGILEHLCMNPNGPLCYCGNHGCLEAYCSVDSLKRSSDMEIPAFFAQLQGTQGTCHQIWKNYLDYLAFAIRNFSILIDGYIIISGYLAPYFREEDIGYLLEKVNAATPFPIAREQILLGTHGQYTPAVGAALYYLKAFIKTI